MAVGYVGLWAVDWGYALSFGGRLGSGQAVSMAISSITVALSLGTAWSMWRFDRPA